MSIIKKSKFRRQLIKLPAEAMLTHRHKGDEEAINSLPGRNTSESKILRRSKAPSGLQTLAIAILAGFFFTTSLINLSTALAETKNQPPPLTQADIDAYVHLIPQLAQNTFRDYDAATKALRESGLSKSHAAYIAGKLALAQAIVEGFINPDKLAESNVPPYLLPSAEELVLVRDNLESIKKAQEASSASPKIK